MVCGDSNTDSFNPQVTCNIDNVKMQDESQLLEKIQAVLHQ